MYKRNYIYNVLKFLRKSATVGNHTYYYRRGKFCVRRRTSLNKERILSDPAFKNFRKCSTQFGQASILATCIYKHLPERKRKHGVIGKLTGQIYQLIRFGLTRSDIIDKICTLYQISNYPTTKVVVSKQQKQVNNIDALKLPVYQAKFGASSFVNSYNEKNSPPFITIRSFYFICQKGFDLGGHWRFNHIFERPPKRDRQPDYQRLYVQSNRKAA